MRERDLRALEFDKVLQLIAPLACSEPGRARIGALRPSADAAEARGRLRAAAEMVELRGRAGALPIAEFSDLRAVFLSAAREGATLDGVSLLGLRDFVLAARHVRTFLRSRVESFPELSGHGQNLLAPKELADALMSSLADDGSLLDEASPQLARFRNRLRNERVELETRLLRSLSEAAMEPFVSDYLVTVRNGRFVLPLKPNYAERLEGIVQDRSVSGETLFVEPMWAVGLNNRLMMLEREVEAEERRIFMHLSAMVRGYLAELRMTFEAMVALDVLNALAIFAERFGCAEPRIAENGIELIAARHPLLLTSGRPVVPIDIRIGAGQRGIVISGPNMGGKTVALKTLGLLALMAQAGILIPAGQGCTLPAFRSIFADIGDEQSIEADLSSFSGHIANLSSIIGSLEEPALVILDEPGAGTDPAEGSALAIGLMSYFSARRCVIAIATHSTAVKLHGYVRAGFEAAAVDFDAEHLRPLYHLKPNTMGQSYGLKLASRLGLPQDVIAAAEAALSGGKVEVEQAFGKLEAERGALERRVQELAEGERALGARERELARTIDREREKVGAERRHAREEAQTVIDELRRAGLDLLSKLKSPHGGRREVAAFVAKAGASLERIAPAASAQEPLKVGDQVEIGDIQGELVALEAGKAIVRRGAMRIEVSPERLKRAERGTPPSPRPPKAPPVEVTVSSEEPSGELNIIGMRATDALRLVEEFLDQAYLRNRSQVRIVHGIGSGALRKALHDYLAASPYCASFREAQPHQGGPGATIVELSI